MHALKSRKHTSIKQEFGTSTDISSLLYFDSVLTTEFKRNKYKTFHKEGYCN